LTLGELIADTARRFAAARLHYGHGTDSARDEAAFLVLRGLGLPFDADLERAANGKRVAPLIEKRIKLRIPAAYLLNEAWLDGVRFYVDRRVIIPRSHIAFLLNDPGIRPRRILDLCTGSGCLAILAARAFPGALVDAGDLSPAALAVARKNIARHRLGRRVRLKPDLFANLRGRCYDLILTNPPYVGAAAMGRLPREYRYEPGLALGAGEDGMDLVARILEAAPEHLYPGGALLCEIGDNRRAFERRFPRLPVTWPLPEVFLYRTRARRPRAS